MQNSIIISVLVFFTYTVAITIKYGWLPSISHSVYAHKKPWLFFSFMAGFGLPLCFYGLGIQEESVLLQKQVIFFGVNIAGSFSMLAGILFIICGASPFFHKKTESGEPNQFESILHSVGAEGGMAFMMLHLGFYEKDWFWGIAMLLPLYIAIKRQFKNHTYWLEIIGAVLISLGIFIGINVGKFIWQLIF